MMNRIKQVSGLVFVMALGFGCSKDPNVPAKATAVATAPLAATAAQVVPVEPIMGSARMNPDLSSEPPAPSPSHVSARKPVQLKDDDFYGGLLQDVDAIQANRTRRIVGPLPKKRWYEDSMLNSWQANREEPREYQDMSRYDR